MNLEDIRDFTSLEIQEIENLSEALINFKKNIRICEKCGCLSDDNICNICLNEKRDKTTLCIVEDSKSVFFIEKTGKYNGLYHVINGLISPIDGIGPEDLNVSNLVSNRINNKIKEVIIALNPTIEGEVTSLYIQKLLDDDEKKLEEEEADNYLINFDDYYDF